MCFQRRNTRSFLLLLSLLPVSTAVDVINNKDRNANSQQRRRRRRLGGRRGETAEDKGEEAKSDTFYDLSLLTEAEKVDMLEKASWLSHFGDRVDWDKQRDKFAQSVRESKIQSVSADVAAAAPSNDDVYKEQLDDALDDRNGELVDTFDGDATADDAANHPQPPFQLSQPHVQTSQSHQRRVQDNSFDLDVFDGYEYARGACPDSGSLDVPCAPDDLQALCNKYDRERGSFRACLAACSPAFCCIHDAPRDLNYLAPNCNTDENCDGYNYCYIAWWKLEDTVGPANQLRVAQDDDFYDLDADEVETYLTNVELLTPLLLHHFDDINEVIEDGTVDVGDGREFDASRIFFDEEYWVYPVAGKIDLDNP